ncbi:hypothetical protein DC094_09345 [Pelagibaculum spongiae]|uniref:Uncharacterized protein n=1 Tax=Pelagibaculum spongiae TaxID=2080658 RepID=A0A2V1GP90_9GAMM|nr:hypothetical protein DC094_20220 [Pelagibaculum spongiae]PVZ69524.1 hypothetical protein DC094_09345 [Pelagibaculum spongiae]
MKGSYLFSIGLFVFLLMSAGIFYFADDGGAFEHYAVAFLWAVLAKFFVEKLLGRPMKYLHFMDIPARPDSEKHRNTILIIWFSIACFFSYLIAFK